MGCSSLGSRALVFWCILLSLIHVSLGSETKQFTWEVEYMYRRPDCFENVVIGINGQFPGPTIHAKAGDTIVVNLTNKLQTEGVVIHWHGIRQPGTYFYHGHYGMQRSAGLYGSLIVDVADGKKEPFGKYDGEFNLLLSDWWHQSIHEQGAGLYSNPFRWIGEPQSLLINGTGQFNCSLAAKFSNSSVNECNFAIPEYKQCEPKILQVLPNKKYRLRIASTTALSSLNLAIGV
ncbi:hypothetical protein DITRI_Ditri05aG0020100 [Diplodiscus trichospermus]